MSASKGKTRIAWLDVLKCIGILEIYFGHLDVGSTLLGAFVWSNHVPLFFFASGCVASWKATPFAGSLKKAANSILLPLLNFGIIACAYCALSGQIIRGGELLNQLCLLIQGPIRNSEFIAGSLWFLSCLFVVRIAFELLKRLRRIHLVLIFGIGIYAAYWMLYQLLGVTKPSLLLNIDSAACYLLYYILGCMLFPVLNGILEKSCIGGRAAAFVCATGLLSFAFTVLVFFKKNPFSYLPGQGWLVVYGAYQLITALIIIYFFCVVSYALRNVVLLQELGKNTLYACGNEQMVKSIATGIFAFFSGGTVLNYGNPVLDLLYCLLLLVIVWKIITPLEDALLRWERKHLGRLSSWIAEKRGKDNACA